MQAKCILNLMTVVAKDNLSITQREDLPQKAYDIGCLVGMLEGEIFKIIKSRSTIIDDLPFKGEILEQFVNGITVIIHRLLLDENQDQLAKDQERLDALRRELKQNLEHTETLLENATRLESALSNNSLYRDSADVLSTFQSNVSTMQNMYKVKAQEHEMLNILVDKNEALLLQTDQSLSALPKLSDSNRLVDLKQEFLRIEQDT
jgi:hypothetical protein